MFKMEDVKNRGSSEWRLVRLENVCWCVGCLMERPVILNSAGLSSIKTPDLSENSDIFFAPKKKEKLCKLLQLEE